MTKIRLIENGDGWIASVNEVDNIVVHDPEIDKFSVLLKALSIAGIEVETFTQHYVTNSIRQVTVISSNMKDENCVVFG
jgi:antitoxin component HigA of HigAB toxin-antitoxin module